MRLLLEVLLGLVALVRLWLLLLHLLWLWRRRRLLP
jgi:hypothetical protein